MMKFGYKFVYKMTHIKRLFFRKLLPQQQHGFDHFAFFDGRSNSGK